jgi:predicted TIM-barrel fold metal-dependent hydrolase
MMEIVDMADLPLPELDDPEGERVPDHLAMVVDAHVHVFPDLLFDAVWGWFDQFGWPIRYRLYTDALLAFLFKRGVRHIVALQYAHKPGIARELNRYLAGFVRRYSAVTGLATVFPGEAGTREILETAFNDGLKGVKLHSHVQCFRMDSPGMHEVYRVCSARGLPLVIHAGREPKSPAYACDPYEICHWTFVERVLETYPELKLVVPHLGADEFDAYRRLQERFDHLWLDTTMMLADYLPVENPPDIGRLRPERLMFGTDFPNIPYAWDRELLRIDDLGLPDESRRWILADTARALYGIDLTDNLFNGCAVKENGPHDRG